MLNLLLRHTYIFMQQQIAYQNQHVTYHIINITTNYISSSKYCFQTLLIQIYKKNALLVSNSHWGSETGRQETPSFWWRSICITFVCICRMAHILKYLWSLMFVKNKCLFWNCSWMKQKISFPENINLWPI